MGRDSKSHTQRNLWGKHYRYGGIFPQLFAFALFLYRLDAQSLWYDEAVSARLAGMSLPTLVEWTAHDIQPPLYYVFLHGWQSVAGHSEWALRFFSAWWAALVVVLAFVLARRLSGSVMAGYVAMILFALAPWLLYYSQEARMYTLLVALSMAWVYLFLRLRRDMRLINAFKVGVLALALFYTHYFALFLIISLSLWHVSLQVVHSRVGGEYSTNPLRSVLQFWGGVFAVILLGYAPWMPFLLQRFRVDASYWGGTLKLNEALRHWAVHMTLGAPETALEADAVRLLPVFAGVTIVALGMWLFVLIFHRGSWPQEGVVDTLTLLMIWFLLPAFLVLGLAYRNPKFNPRYLMVVYPAWLLMWAVAPVLVLRVIKRPWQKVFLLTISLYYFLPAVLFLRADRDWFVNPAFTKPDFRSAISYIRAHRRASETLFLVSGHMSPVVDYYAPDLSYVRLPDMDVLDVNNVLDFGIVPVINRAIQGRTGVWLLLWQDEVVDPMGLVPYLLNHVAQEDREVPNAFWHVRVRHFLLNAGARVPQSPPLTHPAQVDFGDRIEFLGLEYRGKEDLALFFRARAPIDQDVRLHMELWDDEDHFWGQRDARPGPYTYPSFRWKPGQIVLGRFPFPFEAGTPANVYKLRLRLYDDTQPSGYPILDSQRNPQGIDAIVSSLILTATRPLTQTGEVFLPLPPGIDSDHTKMWTLDASSQPLSAEAVRVWPVPPWEPGQRIHAQVRWTAKRAPRPQDRYAFVLVGAGQQRRVAQASLVFRNAAPSAWPSDGRFFTQVSGRIPPNISPGTWTLLLRVEFAEGNASVQKLAQIEISPSQRNFSLPAVVYPIDAEFAGGIRLVGIDVPERWQPGSTLPVTVTWQALSEVNRSYTAFVHLLGPDGKVIAQEDHVPGRGTHPTDEWLVDEVVQDRFDISLPKNMSFSELRLEIGWYDASMPRMPRLKVIRGKDAGRDAVAVVLPQE